MSCVGFEVYKFSEPPLLAQQFFQSRPFGCLKIFGAPPQYLHPPPLVILNELSLRPISLTPCLSKVAEECVVFDYVKSAVLNVLDPSQYGAVPKSSTTQAFIHMLHHWTKGCDGNGATVRVTLYDYKKAFDLIDHRILVNKLCKLNQKHLILAGYIYVIFNPLTRQYIPNSMVQPIFIFEHFCHAWRSINQ